MATIEMVPMILLFVFLTSYTLGAFGIVHTAIKNSISARAYAFETFRNRTNLVYHRDMDASGPETHYKNIGNRVHAIVGETRLDVGGQIIFADERPIRVGLAMPINTATRNVTIHNEDLYSNPRLSTGRRNDETGIAVSPAWVKIQYGICLDAVCGAD